MPATPDLTLGQMIEGAGLNHYRGAVHNIDDTWISRTNKALDAFRTQHATIRDQAVYVERTPRDEYRGIPRIGFSRTTPNNIKLAIWSYFKRRSPDVLTRVQLNDLVRVRGEIVKAEVSITENRDLKLSIDLFDAELTDESQPGRIFIGHGRSPLWKELQQYLESSLKLQPEEFNTTSPAGLATKERLDEMLNAARFAFLVLTAEDKCDDNTIRARENVVHEVGLFQGRLGFRRAIILLEDGCSEFSNIVGLTQIRFPQGNIAAKLSEIESVLRREQLID